MNVAPALIPANATGQALLDHWLPRLEEALDAGHQAAVEERQRRAWAFEPVDHLPIMVTLRDDVAHQTFGHTGWPTFDWEQQMADPARMLLNELAPAWESTLLRDDKCFSIRPNLGIGTIPTLVGCKVAFDNASEDSMPWVVRPEGYTERENLQRLMDAGVPDLDGGNTSTYRRIVEAWRVFLQPYPKLRRFCHLTLPDNQGPFNLAFHLRGESLYLDVYDDPEWVHQFLGWISRLYVAASKHYKAILGEPLDQGFYWNWRLRGGVRNVDDNSVLLGPEQYGQFVKPYNDRSFGPFGGGAHHFCGNVEHIFDSAVNIENLSGVHLGNPELNKFEYVWSRTSARRVCLLWDMPLPEAQRGVVKTGIVIREKVKSMEQAKRVVEQYQAN